MENQALNEVIERLLADGRFVRRFRIDPDGTLHRYGLSPQAVEAVKRGDADELLGLGLAPTLDWPESSAESGLLRRWLLRRGQALGPAAFVAALLIAFPATAGARRAPATRTSKAGAARRVAASDRYALYPHAKIKARARRELRLVPGRRGPLAGPIGASTMPRV